MSQALFSLNNNNEKKKNNLACCPLGTLRVRGNFFLGFFGVLFFVAENRLRSDSRYVGWSRVFIVHKFQHLLSVGKGSLHSRQTVNAQGPVVQSYRHR